MKHAFFMAPAGTSVGLTTVSLGLFNALDRRGVRVAFFKPISQLADDASGLERSTHFIRATTTLTRRPDPGFYRHQDDFGGTVGRAIRAGHRCLPSFDRGR